MRGKRQKSRKGHAVVEVALMSPWIFLLFAAVLDLGFYCYAMIAVENAARVGARYATQTWGSAQDSIGTCKAVLNEMRSLPNIGESFVTAGVCSPPVTVTATRYEGDSNCPEYNSGGGPLARCTKVAVTYTTVPMIPIPGIMGQMTVTRVVWDKVAP
jgi:Flp pilus assembly protein TadG